MRLAFMGTPAFAAVALKAIAEAGHDIAAVYTQPPRPAGRGYSEKRSAVHDLAVRCGLEVRTPPSLKGAEAQAAFQALQVDAAIVVAYGLLLPSAILDAPGHGCFNIHASLLPRWRGAAPIQRAIMAGDQETGITIMKMDQGLDTGPMCRVGRIGISPQMTAGELHDALAVLGAQLIVETLASFPPRCTAQPSDGIIYARKIDKAEARIDFSRPADQVRNHIHGLSPHPGAWCMLGGTRIKVLRCEAMPGTAQAGTVLDDKLLVACGEGAVRFLEVQREGKAPMTADALLRGFGVPPGTRAD